jgi:effector-binding domain-containing protein
VTHEVNVVRVDQQPTVVVREQIPWRLFPTRWPAMSGEVWNCLRAAGITSGCPNIMLYRDAGALVDAEVGVLLDESPPLIGAVVTSALPAGEIATTVSRGPYSGLGDAHDAIQRWCEAHGRQPSETRWEVYGPHSEDPDQLTVHVSWLLSES